MKYVVIAGTFLITASLLIGGLYYPNSPLMWLASTTTSFAVIRGAILVLLGVLLIVRPPRPVYVRAIIGAAATALLVSAVWFTATYMIQPIDTVVFIEVAIIFGIEALETRLPRRVTALRGAQA